MPRLSVLHHEYGPRGFAAIAVNLSESMDGVVKVWARQNANQYLRDDGTVWPAYAHKNAVPTNYVIDPSGVVRYWAGGYDETAVRNAIEAYLPVLIEHNAGADRLTAPAGSERSGTAPVTSAGSLRN